MVITAILAEATNMGLTRMAEACSIATYRQLAWHAAWYLREDTYRPAMGDVATAQQHQPLAALFGAPDVSSSVSAARLWHATRISLWTSCGPGRPARAS